jgi:hypothetical protein
VGGSGCLFWEGGRCKVPELTNRWPKSQIGGRPIQNMPERTEQFVEYTARKIKMNYHSFLLFLALITIFGLLAVYSL